MLGGDKPIAESNLVDFNNNREELMKYLHEKDVNQVSIEHNTSSMYAAPEEAKIIKKKIQKPSTQKPMKKRVKDYDIKEDRKLIQGSPEINLDSQESDIIKQQKVVMKDNNETKKTSQQEIIDIIKRAFLSGSKPPDTISDFYRAGKILGKGAFGKV